MSWECESRVKTRQRLKESERTQGVTTAYNKTLLCKHKLVAQDGSTAYKKTSLCKHKRVTQGESTAPKKTSLCKHKQATRSTSKQYGSSRELTESTVGKTSWTQDLKNHDRKSRHEDQEYQRSKYTCSQDYRDTEQKKRSRRDLSAESRGTRSKRASVERSSKSTKSTHGRRSEDYTDTPCSKDGSLEGDSIPGEEPVYDDNDEMNRNWNGPPHFPMGPYGQGGGYGGYRGRGNFWNRPPPPLPHSFNRYNAPRPPFNRYSHPPPNDRSPWSNDDYNYNFESYGNGGRQGGSNHWDWDSRNNNTWQEGDGAHRDDGRKSHHHSPENTSGADSHSERTATRDNKEQGEKVAGRSSSSSSSLSKSCSSNEKSSTPARPSTAVSSRPKPSTPSSIIVRGNKNTSSQPVRCLISVVGGAATATSSKQPAARRGDGSTKSDSLSCQSQKKDSAVQEPSKTVSKSGNKPSLQAPATKSSSGTAKAQVNPGLPAKSTVLGVSKTSLSRLKTGTSSSTTLASKIVRKPRPTTKGSTIVTETTVQVKQEAIESVGCTTEATTKASLSSSSRNHMIFLSSEEEDVDAPCSKGATQQKARQDDGPSTSEKTVPKARHTMPVPCSSPDRGDIHAKKTLKSPKLGPLSTKDMYRRDVLDKLVNFPSSPQVQAQLNKWMMEMQKSQRSVAPRKALRLCTTQARLGQEDDALQGSIPSIDFDALFKQVESCELPEEMLKSLMQALNADAEQPHSTASEAPSPIVTRVGPKEGAVRSTPELRASPLSTAPSGSGAVARSPATKVTPVLTKASSAAESPGAKSASAQSTKAAAAASSAAASSSDDECVVVPAPKKNVTPVLIDSDEHDPTDEEDNKPSTTTPTVKVLERKAAPPQSAEFSSSPLAQQGSQQVRTFQKHTRRKGRQSSESVDSSLADSTPASSMPLVPVEDDSTETAVAQSPGGSRRPSSRSKNATPTMPDGCVASMATVSSSVATSGSCGRRSQTSVSPAMFMEAPSERPASGHSPLPNAATTSSPSLEAVITKTEPPPTPPPPDTPPDDTAPMNALPPGAVPLNAIPPGAMPLGAMPADAKPPAQAAVKSLVDDLAKGCQLEDAIRQELAQVEQGIASTLATLEQLRRRKEELIAREAQVRKERLEILQCLQGAASALPGDNQPVLHFTLPAQSAAAAEMLSSFGTSGNADMVFGVPQVPQGASPSAIPGQVGGPFPQAPLPMARDIAQLLLPHLQQFGTDIDVNKLTTSLGPSCSSMPTMSPEVSGGPSSRKPTAKRKTARDGEPVARKKTKTTKPDADAETEESQLDQIPPCQEISAHGTAIVALKILGHYIYSCSSDCSARRHNLVDSSQCVTYLGSTKTVNALEVHVGKNQPTVLYTASHDGHLRSYEPETGECTNSFNVESPIICSALAWGKIYLGLHSGHVAVFNLKSQKLQDAFFCSDVSLSRITTATEGAQKLLCTITFDGSITVRDPSTGLLFRCLEGCVQPPCYISVNNGTVYTSSTDRTIRIHELRTGILQKVYECRSAATGLRFHKGLIVCCSFDGLIRFYRAKDFTCEVVYYGAGKNMVMSMDVCGPLIATGNRKGKIEVVKFDKSNLQTCEIRSCNLKFAREDDLVHHLKREHIGLGAKGAMTCPWNQCQMSFSGPNCNKDFEKHLTDHACT